MRERWGICAGIILLLSLGCGPKGTGTTEAVVTSQSPVAEERSVEVVEVIPRAITYTLSAVGSLRTPEHVTLSPKRAGIIQKILVKEGDQVEKGQVLVQLDDVDARLQVERAEARVREAEVSLESSRTTLTRYLKLLESKVIPQQTYDDHSLKVKLDEARLVLARTDLNLARQNLLDHRIVSPIDGVINLKIASLGEHVNVAPKDEVMTIVQVDPLELEFFVPENWAGKIRLGDSILFSVKTFSEEKFSATLRFISPTADPTTRNVKMKALVRNGHRRLKPGFFAEVTIQTGSHSNAHILPESAVFSQEGKSFIYQVQGGTAHRQEVETGHRFEGQVEILKGTQAGERVVTAGHEQLSEGMKVKISSSVEAPSSK